MCGKKLFSIALLLLGSCSTLMTAGAAAGGAAVGSLAGPGGAAIGATAGVVAIDLLEEEAPPEVIGDSPAAAIHETTSLVETIGLWYLAIFVLVPLLTKRGRGWVKKLADIHNSVSQKDIDAHSAAQDTQLGYLRAEIEKLKNKKK
jgi:hypothetical protein